MFCLCSSLLVSLDVSSSSGFSDFSGVSHTILIGEGYILCQGERERQKGRNFYCVLVVRFILTQAFDMIDSKVVSTTKSKWIRDTQRLREDIIIYNLFCSVSLLTVSLISMRETIRSEIMVMSVFLPLTWCWWPEMEWHILRKNGMTSIPCIPMTSWLQKQSHKLFGSNCHFVRKEQTDLSRTSGNRELEFNVYTEATQEEKDFWNQNDVNRLMMNLLKYGSLLWANLHFLDIKHHVLWRKTTKFIIVGKIRGDKIGCEICTHFGLLSIVNPP